MNGRLMVIVEEVHFALFQMHYTKVLGPDSMSALFSQKYWHVVGNDITQAVIDYIHSRKLLKNINFTHLTLILKTNSPEFLSQYRPISFCNVLYKIVSKVLAKRLKSILPSIISESQNAFF